VSQELLNVEYVLGLVVFYCGFPYGPGGPYPVMRIGIVICRTKVTNSDVLDEIDWYFLCYETDASRWYFKLYRRVAGGDVTTVFSKDAEVPLDWDISRSLKLLSLMVL
jgi:hypothetical protein